MKLTTRCVIYLIAGLFLLTAGCQPTPQAAPSTAAPATATPVVKAAAETASGIEPVQFSKETLPNGLRVIYVPVKDTPVVHVRVLYHVGSRDERPDRQGFAHMFEHMMFRGSAHVAPEEHMKLIGIVGGYSNAFTSFDQTTYINTVPANHLEMALYLEADRMASFKVSPEIYQVERNVVAKEWGIRQNRPYGTMFEDFVANAFTKHSYRWTPIGNMEHLKAAAVDELQAFFNKYYLPNNAVLVIAGNFDTEQTKQWVRQFYGWIPKGPEIERGITPEPPQTEARRVEVKRVVPLPAVMVGYKIPSYESPDHAPLSILGTILGNGRTSRLDAKLVYSADPLCGRVSAGPWQLQDGGVFFLQANLLQGKDASDVEKILFETIEDVIKNGVTEEEIAKAKLQSKKMIVANRAEADELAAQVGEEELFAGDAARVNTEVERLFTVTAADVKRVAEKYLARSQSTMLTTVPDPLGVAARAAAANEAKSVENAPVATTTAAPVEPRQVTFPEGYPTRPPMASGVAKPDFAKGVESDIQGVKVIVMEDHRLPQVNWSLTMRRGGHAEPVAKAGLGNLTAQMVRRGVEGMDFQALNQDLESRAISVEVSDGGDFTRISGSAISDQVEHGFTRMKQLLLKPTFPADEFAKLKSQTISQLAVARENPQTVAGHELTKVLWGDSALGHVPTPETLADVTLDDVKQFHAQTYIPAGTPVLIIAGDISVAKGQELAAGLVNAWIKAHDESTWPKQVDYTLPPYQGRRVILVDNPAGKQSVIRIGLPAYTIQTDDKFPGMVAGQILSAGIDSRLGRYVRAEKGYVYGVGAYFSPGRHAGTFGGQTETGFETTAATVEAMFKVFGDLRNELVLPNELSEAQSRVAGGMLMDTQTIEQQAGRRVDAVLNNYPIDYWDKLPARIGEVTADQVKYVMNKYVKDDAMTIIVIAPAERVKEQLEKFGKVETVPMPSKRTATTQPSTEMLK